MTVSLAPERPTDGVVALDLRSIALGDTKLIDLDDLSLVTIVATTASESPELAARAQATLAGRRLAAGHLDEAIAKYQSAITLDPSLWGAYVNLGKLAIDAGRVAVGARAMQQAVAWLPEEITGDRRLDLLYQAAAAATNASYTEPAIALYQQILSQRPEWVQPWFDLGLTLMNADRASEAEKALQRAVELDPDFFLPYDRLAWLGYERGDYEAVLNLVSPERLETALADPQWENFALSVLEVQAYCWYSLRQYDRAQKLYERVLARDPERERSQIQRALIAILLGKIDTAYDLYKELYQRNPTPIVRFNHSMMQLMHGEWEAGWADYTHRWVAGNMAKPGCHCAAWDGSPLSGSLVLHLEQGMGDSLQFIRYARLAKQRCARVVLVCHEFLGPVLSQVQGVDAIIAPGDSLPEDSLACAALLDLPGLLAPTIAQIPQDIPYLHAPYAAEPLPGETPGQLKVGLVWASGHRSEPLLEEIYRQKTCPLELFARYLPQEGVQLYSLQVGEHSADVSQCPEAGIIDLSPRINTFGDTAALIDRLNLVISVDTSVAHLAGGMGKPTWILLSAAADWRWFRDRSDTPWYPTMHLFRQAKFNEWEPVLAQVGEALRARIHAAAH